MIETIPEMKARYEKQIAELQGQIERLTLDLDQANKAREIAEVRAQGLLGKLTALRQMRWSDISEVIRNALDDAESKATTP